MPGRFLFVEDGCAKMTSLLSSLGAVPVASTGAPAVAAAAVAATLLSCVDLVDAR